MQTLSLPPISHPKIAKTARAYVTLADELRALLTHAQGVEQRRAAATRSDREALAEAIRSGKSDPGTAAIEKLDAEFAAARRRVEALQLAIGNAQHDLEASIEQHRSEWRESLERDAVKQREALRGAIEAMRQAHATLALTHAVSAWLAEFPQRTKWSPHAGSWIPGLTQPDGTPFSVDDVTVALLELAEPPNPKTPRMLVPTNPGTGKQLAGFTHGEPLIERLA